MSSLRIEWPPMTLHFASPIFERPPRIICSRISGSPLSGKPTMDSAETGLPPMAYTSLSEFAAAICPNVNGSSTIGVKKSTVCTSAISGLSRYTPASSLVSKPTSTFGSVGRGKRRKTESSNPGLSFAAQPAALTMAVSFTDGVKPHLTVKPFDYNDVRRFVLALAAVGLNPSGESVPRRCLADGYSYLLDEDEVSACPERSAMNLSRGPEVVGRQGEQKEIREQRRHWRSSVNEVDWPAGNRGDQQRRRCHDDEAFMCWGIEAGAKCKENQRRKNQHIRKRNDVEKLRVAACGRRPANQGVRRRQGTKDDHQAAQKEAHDTQPAMDVHAAGGDQRGLSDEQKNPTGKCRAVQMND